ncbi:hypothetical protein H6P81_001175 [Aristolochia fimbriata]|uniref:Uncharacterized protein n=1 Tax=Aristolochia fimbriata TaxID=158543 RepID=A0AAV7F697_ARIFI|nr:hypothetical protein H6P81_001175 [Aristolochia fimbriata]
MAPSCPPPLSPPFGNNGSSRNNAKNDNSYKGNGDNRINGKDENGFNSKDKNGFNGNDNGYTGNHKNGNYDNTIAPTMIASMIWTTIMTISTERATTLYNTSN